MELLFNLVWLLLSLTLLSSLRISRSRAHGHACAADRRRYLTAIVLSFLLLPVISMTDDLHAMTTMTESERTDLRVAAVQSQHQQDHTQIPPAFSAGPVYLERPWICVGAVGSSRPLPGVVILPISLYSDRAPPEK